jgi:hypothetical protein
VTILLCKWCSVSWRCDVPTLLCKEERERDGLTRNCLRPCQSSSVRSLFLVNLHTEKTGDFRSSRFSFAGSKTEVAHIHKTTPTHQHTTCSAQVWHIILLNTQSKYFLSNGPRFPKQHFFLIFPSFAPLSFC